MANTSTSASTEPYNTVADNFYGILCLYCFCFGTVGNVMALLYFVKKQKDVPTIIYNFIVIVDTCISILVFPVAIAFFDERNPWFFNIANRWFCDIWAFFWTTLQRMSVFLVATLAASRAYSLIFPFRVVRKKIILGIIILAFVLHSLGTSIPLWYQARHKYFRGVASCINYQAHKIPHAMVYVIKAVDWLGAFIPIPIIIISFFLTIMQLLKTTSAGGGAGDASKKNVTTTIALFTSLYLVLNIPAAIYILLYNLIPSQIHVIDNRYYAATLMYVLVVPLNSAINPILYFWRMDRMREQSVMLVRKSFKRARGGLPSPEPYRLDTNDTYIPTQMRDAEHEDAV